MAPNPYLLAAENSPALLPLLREKPSLASAQDEHGYSLVHAAASYNYLDLLRTLVREFSVDVNIKDEDGETALFVTETVEAASCLVEDLGADIEVCGDDGVTPREKIEVEGDFPAVAEYLKGVENNRTAAATKAKSLEDNFGEDGRTAPAIELPPVPEGLDVTVGTMNHGQEVPDEVDPDFKRRIEQLAEREDFHTAQGQAELRRLVEDAVADQGLGDERSVRPKQG